jgi:cell wall-associated NlpC family hydrolase
MGLTDTIRNKVNSLFNFDSQQQSNQLKNKIDTLYGKQNTTTAPNINSFNPFISKRDGQVINKMADYKPIVNSSATSDKVREWITQATGIQPANTMSNSSNSTQNENSTALSSGTINSNGDDNVGFNGNLDSSSLGSLDVATQLPKLSTAQIAEIIKKHFNRSSVISTSDAEGIYNAQKTTGMSALAILGIGALESGWGTSNIAKKTNNIWGYGATNVNPEGNAHRYGQMSQGATQFASEFMKTYYNGYGAKSINSAGTGNNPKGMGYAYTDGGAIDSSWATQVSSIMGQLYNTAKSVSGSNTGNSSSNSSSNSSRSYLNRLSYANNSNTSSGGSSKGRQIVAAAKQYLGTPYVYGGTSSSGVDCSGLVQLAAKASGIDIPRTTYDQINVGQAVSKNNLQEGDLVFFRGSGGSTSAPGHVGIYIGNGQYIQAPKTGDVVKISNLSGRSDYVGARRIA